MYMYMSYARHAFPNTRRSSKCRVKPFVFPIRYGPVDVEALCRMHAIRFARRCVDGTIWRAYDTTFRCRKERYIAGFEWPADVVLYARHLIPAMLRLEKRMASIRHHVSTWTDTSSAFKNLSARSTARRRAHDLVTTS